VRRPLLLGGVVAAATIVGVLIACSSNSPLPIGYCDSGSTPCDSTSYDAAGDAGDAALATDSSNTAGFTDGWVRVPWQRACSLYQPAAPQALANIPEMHWRACPDGIAGCQELALDWPTDLKPAALSIFGFSAATDTDGSALLSFGRSYTETNTESVVWNAANGYIAAWRLTGETSCSQVNTSISSGQMSVMANDLQFDGGLVSGTYHEVVGAPRDLLAKTSPDYTFAATAFGAGLMEEASASPQVGKYRFGEGELEVYRDRATGSVDTLRGEGGPPPSVQYSQIVGDTVYAVSPPNIVTWKAGVGLRNLIVAPDGNTLEHGFATDGVSMIWVESSNADSSQISHTNIVYESPLTDNPASITPKAILSSVGFVCSAAYCVPHLSGGYLTIQQFDPTVIFATIIMSRLSDGAFWRMQSSASLHEAWGEGYVLNGEWWHEASYYGANTTIQRFPLAALGAPSTD